MALQFLDCVHLVMRYLTTVHASSCTYASQIQATEAGNIVCFLVKFTKMRITVIMLKFLYKDFRGPKIAENHSKFVHLQGTIEAVDL